jgi:hypothetical protein
MLQTLSTFLGRKCFLGQWGWKEVLNEAGKKFLDGPLAAVRVVSDKDTKATCRKHGGEAVKPDRVASMTEQRLAVDMTFHESVEHTAEFR